MTCKTCGDLEHDEAIHRATISIHRWLKRQVCDSLLPPPPPRPPRAFTPPPGVPGITNLMLRDPAARKRASRLGARGQRR
jgi:hypothetical protein